MGMNITCVGGTGSAVSWMLSFFNVSVCVCFQLNWLMGLTSKRLAETYVADKEKGERLKQIASSGA